MPTRQQMDSVTQRIEALSEDYSFRRYDDRRVAVAPHGRGTDDGFSFWGELTDDQKQFVLAGGVDWTGFTEAQKADVIRRVLDGEEADFWMDGVKTADNMPDNPSRRAENEIREIKGRENNRTLAQGDFLGLGDGWTTIGTVDIGKWGDWNEPQRLAVLLDMVNWEGIAAGEKRRMLEREVDFSKVAPDDQRLMLGEVWHQNDSEPVARVPEDSRREGPEGQASPEGQAQPVRPLTQQLIDCCYLDIWPGNAAVVDFGIDSDRHLGALQFAIRDGLVTPQELDAAMGNGPKLTEIARRGQNPYRDVTFKTSWDDMPIEPDAAPPPPLTAAILDNPKSFLPDAEPPPSLTAAILDNPKSFLPDSGPSPDHDHGPDRGR